MRKRELFSKLRFIFRFFEILLSLFPKFLIKFLFNLFKNKSGNIGFFIRYVCVKNLAEECGDNIAIFPSVYLNGIENLKLGSNISIHPMCYIDSTGGIEIMSNVSIAHSTTILSSEHIHSDLEINIKDQGLRFKKTIICENVWIGCGCRILAGTKIEKGSILAAGAVLTKNLESNSIYGGTPAKLIRRRV